MTGRACGICEPGFALWGHTCADCSQTPVFARFLIVGGLFVLLMLVVYGYHRVSRNTGSGRVHVLIFFVQSAQIILGAEAPSLSRVASFTLINFSRTNGICFAEVGQATSMLIGLLAPVVVALALLCVTLVSWCLFRYQQRRCTRSVWSNVLSMDAIGGAATGSADERLLSRDAASDAGCIDADGGGVGGGSDAGGSGGGGGGGASRFEWESYLASMVCVFSLTKVTVVKSAFDVTTCYVVDGREVVYLYPEIECSSPVYFRLRALAISMLVTWVVLLPVVFAVVIVKSRRARQASIDAQRSQEHVWLAATSTAGRASSRPPPSVAALRVASTIDAILTGAYRRDVFWYEFVALIRNVGLVGVSSNLGTELSASSRYYASAIFNVLSYGAHSLFHPFRSDAVNHMQQASHVLLVLLPMALLLLGNHLNVITGIIVEVVLVIIPAAIMLWLTVIDFFAFLRERTRRGKSVRSKSELARRSSRGSSWRHDRGDGESVDIGDSYSDESSASAVGGNRDVDLSVGQGSL